MARARPVPDSPSVLEDLPFRLARLQLAFRRVSDRSLRDQGLAPQPIGTGSVLYSLLEQDDCLVGSLVSRTHLPNATVTGILDRLERQGLVTRVRDSNDGRAWRIRLTPKSRALRPRLRERHARVMRLFADALEPATMRELGEILERLTEALRASLQRPREPRRSSGRT